MGLEKGERLVTRLNVLPAHTEMLTELKPGACPSPAATSCRGCLPLETAGASRKRTLMLSDARTNLRRHLPPCQAGGPSGRAPAPARGQRGRRPPAPCCADPD